MEKESKTINTYIDPGYHWLKRTRIDKFIANLLRIYGIRAAMAHTTALETYEQYMNFLDVHEGYAFYACELNEETYNEMIRRFNEINVELPNLHIVNNNIYYIDTKPVMYIDIMHPIDKSDIEIRRAFRHQYDTFHNKRTEPAAFIFSALTRGTDKSSIKHFLNYLQELLKNECEVTAEFGERKSYNYNMQKDTSFYEYPVIIKDIDKNNDSGIINVSLLYHRDSQFIMTCIIIYM